MGPNFSSANDILRFRHAFTRLDAQVTQASSTRRPLLKAAEVCDIAKVQPYVLRSWEKEFPSLGVSKDPEGPRFYRRTDLERHRPREVIEERAPLDLVVRCIIETAIADVRDLPSDGRRITS